MWVLLGWRHNKDSHNNEVGEEEWGKEAQTSDWKDGMTRKRRRKEEKETDRPGQAAVGSKPKGDIVAGPACETSY